MIYVPEFSYVLISDKIPYIIKQDVDVGLGIWKFGVIGSKQCAHTESPNQTELNSFKCSIYMFVCWLSVAYQ